MESFQTLDGDLESSEQGSSDEDSDDTKPRTRRASKRRAAPAEATSTKKKKIPIGRHTAAVGSTLDVVFSTGVARGVVTGLKG